MDLVNYKKLEQGGMLLLQRGAHVLVHETEPERSDAF